MDKFCTKCETDKPLKYFSKRTKPKKDGSPSYSSWCKRCSVISQNDRVKTNRAKARYIKKIATARDCVICGDVYYSTLARKKTCCVECSEALKYKNYRAREYGSKANGMRGKNKGEKKISKKFLERGKISYEGHR